MAAGLRRRPMHLTLGRTLIVLALCSALACAGAGPRRAFEQYREAILATDWDAAWTMLSDDVRARYENSSVLFASELSALFVNRDLRLQFTTTRIEGVEYLEDGEVAVIHATHETPTGERASRTWRLVQDTEAGWRLDEL